jgi:hypothetical protein
MTNRIRINAPNVIFDESEGVIVIINLVTGHYFRLSEASAMLWKLLLLTPTEEDLASSCTNPEIFLNEWSAILEVLSANELIVVEPTDVGLASTVPSWEFQGFALESFTDLEDILALDPIHEVDPGLGWPHARNE